MRRTLISNRRPASKCTARRRPVLFLESLEDRRLLSITFNEFAVPSGGASFGGITLGPDKNLWFTESARSAIGEINPTTHSISEFPLGQPGTPVAITSGPDGNLWFTVSNGFPRAAIGEINPATHTINEFQTDGGPLVSITTGPDGLLWFTAEASNAIGVINPTTHSINYISVSTDPTNPTQIISGPGGKLWFTQLGSTSNPAAINPGEIGELDPATDAVTEFALPPGFSAPTSITVEPDGNLWFLDVTSAGNGLTAEIARLNPTTGAITEYSIGPTQSQGGGFFFPSIVPGPDGKIWFSWPLTSGDVIGSIDPTSGAVSTFPTATGHSVVQMTFGPDGNLWYTENASYVGEADVSSLTTSLHNEAYVTAVYKDVLGRGPDPDGLAYWTQKLDSGVPRSSVAEAIGKSDEYYQNFVIKPDYLKILGRVADSGGLSHWTTQMDSGTTDQELQADLAASDEVYHDAGGTDLDWVDSVYKLLLNRTADAKGEQYWVGQLAAGVPRIQVAEGIAGSQENNTQLINADYQHYLGRSADPDGLAFWLTQFADGKTNEDVIAGFTGSDEYYNKHTS